MLHPRKILKNKEPSILMLSLSSTSKCNTVSHAPSTPGSSKLDPLLRGESGLHPRESKEMLQAESSPRRKTKNDCILKAYVYFIEFHFYKYHALVSQSRLCEFSLFLGHVVGQKYAETLQKGQRISHIQ